MKITRRTFLKTSGSLISVLLAKTDPAFSDGRPIPRVEFGKEVQGRCPLCSVGCGVIYRSTGLSKWVAEGDPDCPICRGSLCAVGTSLVYMSNIPREKMPLYRLPGSNEWERISWDKAIEILARRLKDIRDRDLSLNLPNNKSKANRIGGLGLLAGGFLSNEEAYKMVQLFRCLGVHKMDTTVRAGHGIGVLGLLDALGIPGATHPANQIAYSDVVILVGSNPGQTSPVISRFLDKVRQRRGVVIVIDSRKTETVKEDDLFLQVRPGTDGAVLGAFINWIMERGALSRSDLLKNSDAPFMILSQEPGDYERYDSGKNKNRLIVDKTLEEPESVFQRLKIHFGRYSLKKIAGITGLDIDLLRRACTLIARTVDPHFSASIVLGSGALGHHSGLQVVRMAAFIQALLGNLDKKGGGLMLASDAGNAQGVCDMGFLSPFFPGYLDLTTEGTEGLEDEERKALEALCRTWYPELNFKDAIALLPQRPVDERHSVSTIIQGISAGEISSLITAGTDPVSVVPGSASMPEAMAGLDLLVVLDVAPGRTGEFWKGGTRGEDTIKTEVLFIPTEPPASMEGSMTDSGRRARTIRPIPDGEEIHSRLLEFIVELGSSIKSKYSAEGGVLEDAVLKMNWPSIQDAESVAAEINGWRKDRTGRKALIPQNGTWEKTDQCGNRLYRGWMTSESWLAGRRESADPDNIALYGKWGWFWPRGVPDPYSWVEEKKGKEGVYLRWEGQSEERHSAEEVLLSQGRPPVRFWSPMESGMPFPEHYEPFYSPMPDLLTEKGSSPHLILRTVERNEWEYLFKKPKELPGDYTAIVTSHRMGNIVGTGGITAMVPQLRELGTQRFIEISPEFAASLDVDEGDRVMISTPLWKEGITAVALVTARMNSFSKGREVYYIASITRYGEGDKGINALTTPAFDNLSGGLEARAFMGKIKKV